MAAAAAAAAMALPATAVAAVDETLLVSRANGPAGTGAASFAADPSISDNGCRIAFGTTADNLAATDPTAGQNVILRDVCAGTTEAVAMDRDDGSPADEHNSTPAISGDGCRVAFWTTDSLDFDDDDPYEEGEISFPDQANEEGSVYVRDVCAGETILASMDASNNSVPASEGQTSISADGSLVAFATRSHVDVEGGLPDGNPVNPPLSAPRDVYVRDLDANQTFLVSLNAAGTGGAGGDTLTQGEGRNSMSDSGRFLSLRTTASDLLPPGADTNGAPDVYVRDLQAGSYERATLNDAEGQLTGPTAAPAWAISGDGRHVAFTSASPELGGDGQFQVWLRDLGAGTTELISRASGPEGDLGSTTSSRPALDESGRFVAFASAAPNLATFVNGAQVHVRDTLNQTTHAISRKSGHLGALSSGPSPTEDIVFSDDGRFAAFASSSPSLAPIDINGGDMDVFRRELAEPPAPATRRTFNARPIATGVDVNLPGPGRPRPLETIRQLPIGSVVDATQGRVAATTTGNSQSKPVQTAEFYGARFVVTQRRNTLVLMKLKGAPGCGKPKGRKGGSAAAAPAPVARVARRRRGLWGSGKGRYGTRGGRGAGTVRGTVWYVENRCDGSTLFKVKQGTVAVDDFGKKGKVDKVLRAPGRYVAKAESR